jgi:hypothetical protein
VFESEKTSLEKEKYDLNLNLITINEELDT